MSFLGGLFTGSNPTLSSDIGQTGALAGFSSNLGQNDTSAASNYYQKLLSGDPAQIAQSLAPEISANAQQAQQQKQTMGEFGARTGGNTAAAANIDANSRANIINLIGQLMGGAASNLGNLGTQNLSMAGTDLARQGEMSQEQLQNQQNSILGQLIGGLTSAAGTAAIGMI